MENRIGLTKDDVYGIVVEISESRLSNSLDEQLTDIFYLSNYSRQQMSRLIRAILSQ